MKISRNVLLILAALVLAAQAPVSGQGWGGDADFLLAGKHLDHDDWDPTSHQGELGVLTNWRGPDWPVALAADLLVSGADEDASRGGFTEQRGSTSELDLGVRKVFRTGAHARPYVGGGLGAVSGRIELRGPAGTVSDRDSGLGVWLNGGIFWTIDAFNIGADVRLSSAQVRLFGADKNAGGVHLGMLVGYHWGG